MTFLVGFDFTAAIKLILIIATVHCMLFLAASLHSLITADGSKVQSLNFQAISVIRLCSVNQPGLKKA